MKECGWISKALWQKPETQDYILYDSIHMTFQKMQNYKGKKLIGGCQGLGKAVTISGILGGDTTVLYLECTAVSKL